jgi:hypothetical protein
MDSWGAFADRIHGDHYPVDDKYHTGYWQKGEIIKDVFKIRIPFSYNAPKIATWIGFYVGDNRMPVDTSMQGIQHDGSNRVNAGYIPVVLKK